MNGAIIGTISVLSVMAVVGVGMYALFRNRLDDRATEKAVIASISPPASPRRTDLSNPQRNEWYHIYITQ